MTAITDHCMDDAGVNTLLTEGFPWNFSEYLYGKSESYSLGDGRSHLWRQALFSSEQTPQTNAF